MPQVNDTKTALVTGANKGIGFAIAQGLGALGFTVAVGARDETGARRRSSGCAALESTRSASPSTSPPTTASSRPPRRSSRPPAPRRPRQQRRHLRPVRRRRAGPDDAGPGRRPHRPRHQRVRRRPRDERGARTPAPLGRAAHRQRLEQHGLADPADRSDHGRVRPVEDDAQQRHDAVRPPLRRHERDRERAPAPAMSRPTSPASTHRARRSRAPRSRSRSPRCRTTGRAAASSTTTASSPGERYQTLARQLQRSSRRTVKPFVHGAGGP